MLNIIRLALRTPSTPPAQVLLTNFPTLSHLLGASHPSHLAQTEPGHKCATISSSRGMATEAVEETRSTWKVGQASQGPPSSSQAPPASSNVGSVIDEDEEHIVRVLNMMGLQPGRECVVGDGLTTISITLDPSTDQNAPQQGGAKLYAVQRTQQRLLQTFGWMSAGRC
eukprot:gene9923-7793_t